MNDVCARCGRLLEPEDRFCSACGTPRVREDDDPTGVVVVDERDTGPIPVVEGLSGLTKGMSVIVVQRGPAIGQRFELSGERLTVGRSADADIMLDDVTVSRHHADLLAEGGGWVLADTGSLNGSYVNRRRIERAPLAGGDEVQIGKYRFVYLAAAGEGGETS